MHAFVLVWKEKSAEPINWHCSGMESLVDPAGWSYNGTEKVCRFCGCDNEENVDIFSANKADAYHRTNMDQENLLHKISTVYPFLLYKNDPLPQHICPECIDIVCSLYRDIQQVLRHQKNLMNLIKAQQPEHTYFRILNSIEKSINATKESIKLSYDVDVSPNIPRRLFKVSPENNQTSNTASCSEPSEIQKPVNDNLVKNIQTKLELNGFTIKRIKVAAAQPTSDTICPEDDFNADDNEICSYCNECFPTQEALALHQVTHLKLSTERIFEKRLLPKRLRRGRLITINNEKNIRCLNCWQIFKDNKAILQHWSGSDCHFFCFICSQEFPQSPKQLREHIPAVHGISYRSAAKQYILSHSDPPKLTEEIKESTGAATIGWKLPQSFVRPLSTQSVFVKKPNKKKRYYYKTTKSSTKHADGTFSCNVCHKVFTNYRSSNSHMRVHYVTDICASAVKKDVYTKNDEVFQPLDPPPSSASTSNQHLSPLLKPLAAMIPIRPSYKIIKNYGPLRGIKTKIVQKRNEFLANNCGSGISEKHRKYSDWMASTADSDQLNIDESSISSSHSNNFSDVNDFTMVSPQSVVKKEPSDIATDVGESRQWNCFICKEYFASSKEYEMHAMFVHNIN